VTFAARIAISGVLLMGACKERTFMLKVLSRYGVPLAIFQALSACGQSPVAAPPEKPEQATKQAQYDKLVVVFGDSLYAGYRLGPKEGLAPQLQAALEAKGINARVHNAGVSGDTSAAGKGRLNFVLDSLDRKPDLVVLGLGGNDMLRGIKPMETQANMIAMLDTLKKNDIEVVLTGMLASPNMGPDYASAFNPIFPKLAKQYDTPLLPFFLDGVVTDKALMLDDGLHPNAKGLAVVVGKLAPLVVGALGDGNR
jgi:acyl-CoA thioesterase-1